MMSRVNADFQFYTDTDEERRDAIRRRIFTGRGELHWSPDFGTDLWTAYGRASLSRDDIGGLTSQVFNALAVEPLIGPTSVQITKRGGALRVVVDGEVVS